MMNWLTPRNSLRSAIHQKTAFVQDISHQIRTPLNIVMGFSQVLRDCGDEMPPEEVKQLTGLMNRNVKSLNRMVLMLLDSSDVGLSEEMKSLEGRTYISEQDGQGLYLQCLCPVP